MIDFDKIQESDKVKITCVDSEEITGVIVAIDDEEESDIGEIGITVATKDGKHIIIGESEIKEIVRVKKDHGQG